MTLTLFPPRIAIGTVVGTSVMQTPEFARALANLLMRVGGPDGMGISDIQKELARRPSTLAQAAPGKVLTGTINPVVLASVVVPPGAMGSLGMVRITTVWSITNNENNKTFINRFGGEDISRNVVTTVSTYQDHQSIQNRTLNQQVFVFGGGAYTGAPIGSLNIDTTLAQTIAIAAQLESSNDSVTLEAYTVELIPSP